jgi:signal peptidase I
MGGQQLTGTVTEVSTHTVTVSRRPVRAVAGLVWMVTCWTTLTFIVATGFLTSGGEFHKYQFMSVLSGSMVPTVNVGDLVVAAVVAPDELHDGDLATFRQPDTGRLITHRVQSILWRGNIADVITRGDANSVGENWSVTADAKVGRVAFRVPRVGYVVGALGTPPGQIGLAALAAFLGMWILVVIWGPGRDKA